MKKKLSRIPFNMVYNIGAFAFPMIFLDIIFPTMQVSAVIAISFYLYFTAVFNGCKEDKLNENIKELQDKVGIPNQNL